MNPQPLADRFNLSNKSVAVLTADGFEQSELLVPVDALQSCGASVDIITPDGKAVRGWDNRDWGQKISPDHSLSDVSPEDYDAILLPGGVLNSDSLRSDKSAREFVRHFFNSSKPAFVICHGSQILIDADLVSGRKMTSFPAIAKDLQNAGAQWSDEEVVVDQGFVTSRSPDDLPAFCAKICEELAEGIH